jgi:hypothetical protein
MGEERGQETGQTTSAARDRRIVARFLDLIAAGFVALAVATGFDGEYGRAAAALISGLVVFLCGMYWSHIRQWLGPVLSRSMVAVASNGWAWLAVLFVLFCYLAAPSFIAHINNNRPTPVSPVPGSEASSTPPRPWDNLYVSFSFPRPAGVPSDDVEIEIKLINNQENAVSVENISAVELFGNDKNPYGKLDECYDPNVAEFKTKNDNISSEDATIQGVSVTKRLDLVSYKQPIKITLDNIDARFPLIIRSKQPVIAKATFEINPYERKKGGFNFFVICPTIKFFDTRGQDSVSICPDLIDISFSKEEYNADSRRIAGFIPLRDHIKTIGPSSESGDKYRVLASRAGQFQLTPKIGTNSCPLVSTD